MQYSTNYSLKKPQYGEAADIADINDNTDDIDNLIHQNRTMIAPAFDSETAYSAGDVVVYLGELYKFTADKAAGAWDANVVEHTTAAEVGNGGGSAEVTKTAEGNPLTFSDGADAPLVECQISFSAKQSGSGTPSPSNIRPITGYDEVEITVADDDADPTVEQTYTISLGDTYYSGTIDAVRGVLSQTWGYIASYAGETLTGEWLSDRDEYVSGGTPTTGAEVAYELATPLEISLTPTTIKSLLGINTIWTDADTLEVEYITEDYQPLVDLIDSHVVANSSAEATEVLTKLTIGGVTYALPQGGGGSTITVLGEVTT